MSGLALLDAPVGKEDSEGGSCCEHSDELYFEESRRGDGKSSDGDDFRLEALFFGVEDTRISFFASNLSNSLNQVCKDCCICSKSSFKDFWRFWNMETVRAFS